MQKPLCYVYQRCILLHKCEQRYPYLNNNIEGFSQWIADDKYLFYPIDDQNLPKGCSREDFCGYVIDAECLDFIGGDSLQEYLTSFGSSS